MNHILSMTYVNIYRRNLIFLLIIIIIICLLTRIEKEFYENENIIKEFKRRKKKEILKKNRSILCRFSKDFCSFKSSHRLSRYLRTHACTHTSKKNTSLIIIDVVQRRETSRIQAD